MGKKYLINYELEKYDHWLYFYTKKQNVVEEFTNLINKMLRKGYQVKRVFILWCEKIDEEKYDMYFEINGDIIPFDEYGNFIGEKKWLKMFKKLR